MTDVDKQYLEIVKEIIDKGVKKYTRAGWVKSIFGKQLRIDLKKGLPVLTTKKVFTKGVLHELLWFLNGNTNIKYLVENGVHIWDDDAYRWYMEWVKTNVTDKFKERSVLTLNGNEISCDDLTMTKEMFLDNILKESVISIKHNKKSRGQEYVFGDLGDVYGKQWRSFGVSGRDQITDIIDKLKKTPNDRRMLCVAFNPDVLGKVALPPCHVMFQFYTRELEPQERLEWIIEHDKDSIKGNDLFDAETTSYNATPISELRDRINEIADSVNAPKYGLSCMWTQRSCDLPSGVPFNICSYSILTHIIAKLTNMIPDELIGSLGDCHIYLNQMEGIEEQLSRQGKDTLPKLIIKGNQEKIEDFKYEDFEIVGYESDPIIRFPLSVGL